LQPSLLPTLAYDPFFRRLLQSKTNELERALAAMLSFRLVPTLKRGNAVLAAPAAKIPHRDKVSTPERPHLLLRWCMGARATVSWEYLSPGAHFATIVG